MFEVALERAALRFRAPAAGYPLGSLCLGLLWRLEGLSEAPESPAPVREVEGFAAAPPFRRVISLEGLGTTFQVPLGTTSRYE